MSKEREPLILDVGCGRSSHVGLYARENTRIIGLDRLPHVLTEHESSEIAFGLIAGDGEKLPFSNETFDEVYCTGALNHFDNPQHALEEIQRVLKDGGKLVLDIDAPLYEKIMGRIEPRHCSKDMHKHTFTPREARELVEDTGFKVTEFSQRMWFSALVITVRWGLECLIHGEVNFEPHTGRLLKDKGSLKRKGRLKGKLIRAINDVLWVSENKQTSPKRFYLLSPLRLLNQIYPWMIYIEAIKTSK